MDQASRSRLANRLARHLAGAGALAEPIRCAEIGARKPLSGFAEREPFYTLESKQILAFEGEPAEAERLQALLGPEAPIRFVGAAVGGADGEAELFVTRDPKCSSLYKPNDELIARYPGLAVATLDHRASVRVTTLGSALASVGWRDVHFLKMDIQGAELDVLRGAGACLDGTVALVTEVSFQPIYQAQPLFEDVLADLRRRGFELYRLLTQGGTARATARRDQSQLLWADALFFRPPEVLARSDAARLAVLATLYGALDVAECALERVGAAERAWFVAQTKQPWRDRADDARRQVRRIRRGLARRLLSFARPG